MFLFSPRSKDGAPKSRKGSSSSSETPKKVKAKKTSETQMNKVYTSLLSTVFGAVRFSLSVSDSRPRLYDSLSLSVINWGLSNLG